MHRLIAIVFLAQEFVFEYHANQNGPFAVWAEAINIFI
tara:strand:- start:628 stop:741 length:114 start_codon:yes stop_codon:yes gene_type:complete